MQSALDKIIAKIADNTLNETTLDLWFNEVRIVLALSTAVRRPRTRASLANSRVRGVRPRRWIYTGFYERSHGDTIEFRPENLRVCLDYLYEWTCQILVKSADQFLSN